jgi:hypothetical protein
MHVDVEVRGEEPGGQRNEMEGGMPSSIEKRPT